MTGMDATTVKQFEDYNSRPDSTCIGCGKTDKAPKDKVGLASGDEAAFHFNCHARMGCEICIKTLKALDTTHEAGGLQDEALLGALYEVAKQDPSDQPKIFSTSNPMGFTAKDFPGGAEHVSDEN